MAIVRFVARKLHLADRSELHEFKCDIVAETVQELNEHYVLEHDCFLIKTQSKKQAEQQILPLQSKQLETFMDIYSKEGIHFVGHNTTWPDLIVYSQLEDLLEIDGQEKLLNKYSKSKKTAEEIGKTTSDYKSS